MNSLVFILECAFMSLSAILTAQNIPLIDWSTTTFNNVLSQGDKLYLKALNNDLIDLDPGVEFLSVSNCQKFLVFHILLACFLTIYSILRV